jgi:DNA polymerase I-like protein with 3'-5' exonuclease and polymerase domains/uracil-DNA glycosylase
LLIVGDSPNQEGDLSGLPFRGHAGDTLRQAYIDHFGLTTKVDVYLVDSVRCRPPHKKKANKTQVKACQGFLLADLRTLQQLYEEVVILVVGGQAAQSVTGGSLKNWLSHQGEMTDFQALLKGVVKSKLAVLDILGFSPGKEKGEKLATAVKNATDALYPRPCRVFATYHPDYLFHNPSAGLSLHSHLRLLNDYLEGNLTVELQADLSIQVAPLPPSYSFPRLAFDIETYGLFFDGPDQTQFHPRKMETYDCVPKSEIIRTVGLTWANPIGELQHAIFLMQRMTHRRRLWSWLKKIRADKKFEMLVGSNLNFDLVCVRHCYPECKVWLDYPLPIMDTIITNYLHDETRPEKSLKNLGPLFRISKYETEGPVKRFENASDQKEWQYNCQDTFTSYRLQEKLEEEIRKFYGPMTSKLTPYCMSWYTELLWLLVWMGESGIQMLPKQLQDLFDSTLSERTTLAQYALTTWNFHMGGKGSETDKRTLMYDSVIYLDQQGAKLPKMEKTKATGDFSFCVENRNALLNALRDLPGGTDTPIYEKLITVGKYQDASKLLDSYLYPILKGRGKDHADHSTCHIGGIVYPKWFPVPSEFEDASTGGTKQARIVAKGPGVQTFPKSIKSLITGRFPGGYLIWFDYSQIELRMAALLSNDMLLMQEYTGKPDLHTKTARLIFGDSFCDQYILDNGQDAWDESKYRHAGKTQNFLMLNLGGAERFHASLMTDVGLNYPVEQCQAAIDAFWIRHCGLHEWHLRMQAFVAKHGYFELPLIGQSRLFLGGRRQREKFKPEIANLPIQAVAAVTMQSCQFHLWRMCKERKLRTVVPLNVYDAAVLEVPKDEIHAVREILALVLPNPPYFSDLCDHLGRRIPLLSKITETKLELNQKNNGDCT